MVTFMSCVKMMWSCKIGLEKKVWFVILVVYVIDVLRLRKDKSYGHAGYYCWRCCNKIWDVLSWNITMETMLPTHGTCTCSFNSCHIWAFLGMAYTYEYNTINRCAGRCAKFWNACLMHRSRLKRWGQVNWKFPIRYLDIYLRNVQHAKECEYVLQCT